MKVLMGLAFCAMQRPSALALTGRRTAGPTPPKRRAATGAEGGCKGQSCNEDQSMLQLSLEGEIRATLRTHKVGRVRVSLGLMRGSGVSNTLKRPPKLGITHHVLILC